MTKYVTVCTFNLRKTGVRYDYQAHNNAEELAKSTRKCPRKVLQSVLTGRQKNAERIELSTEKILVLLVSMDCEVLNMKQLYLDT